jgi:hypothetical protein
MPSRGHSQGTLLSVLPENPPFWTQTTGSGSKGAKWSEKLQEAFLAGKKKRTALLNFKMY